MKIKEVEDHVGISSKNIRFYEKEGLISPERNLENQYREYSSNDIRKLKEIKLLRKLGIPVETIRILQSGEVEMGDVLGRQIERFDDEIHSLMGAKSLCSDIKYRNMSLKEMDVDNMLFKMHDMEGKGVRFMNIGNDEILRYLPERYKMKYYEAIIRNGQIDCVLLKEIIDYIEDIYKRSIDIENFVTDILKNVELEERTKIMQLASENNRELYERISGKIYSFEDIINVHDNILKQVLSQFDEKTIVIASMGASPAVNDILRNILPQIDFVTVRKEIGMIPLKEVESIHENIINAINRTKQ